MATFETMNDFLSGPRMTQIAQSMSEQRGLPQVLPAALLTPSSRKPSNDHVEYDSIVGSRRLARLVNRNSPSATTDKSAITKKYATCLNPKNNFTLESEFLEALKSDLPVTRANAVNALINWMNDQTATFQNTRGAIVSSALALGKIYSDGDGNILPTSTGAKLTVDYGIPTGNQITKDGSGSTYNIGNWSTASTDIGSAAKALRLYNLKANGYPLRTVLYGSDIPGYIRANTTMQQFLKLNPLANDALSMRNEIPNGFLKFNWVSVDEAYFLDSTGTAQTWFPSNFLGFMPDVTPDWYEFVEGGTAIPVPGVANVTSGTDPAGDTKIVNGVYSYGTPRSYDPIQQKLVMGDCFVPVIKVPGTYYFGVCS